MTGDGRFCRACLDPDAEIQQLRIDLFNQVRRVADRDSEIGRLRRAISRAHQFLTPGSRAGTAEAKGILGSALLVGMVESKPVPRPSASGSPDHAPSQRPEAALNPSEADR